MTSEPKQSQALSAPPNFKTYASAEEVRWCPGCGDYAILKTMQKTLAAENIPPEQAVFVSGIGCAARFPYYMNTYGFHTIHGRAPTIATGLKLMRPDLHVWVVTGDGDALSIGGNHYLHLIRRNVDLTILLFNNRIYGLTKGQYSPTSPVGTISSTSPQGTQDQPLSPLAVAMAAGATFVARALDVDSVGLQATLQAALAHRGTSVVEIYQNCHIYNDGAFERLSQKATRPESALYCEAGQPLRFGSEQQWGMVRADWALRAVNLDQSDQQAAAVIIHDPNDAGLAERLVRLEYPQQPVALGVLYQAQRACYPSGAGTSFASVKSDRQAALHAAFHAGQTWQMT